MKVFEIEFCGEVETVAASNALQAILWYCNSTGLGLDDFESDDDIEEIPDSENWDKIMIGNDDNNEVISLREAMKGVSEPCLICSTAY